MNARQPADGSFRLQCIEALSIADT